MTPPLAPAAPLLDLQAIEVRYDRVMLALKGVSLQVGAGQVVALLGANGAGKSTTLRAISGLLVGERGAVTQGQILLGGEAITSWDPARVVARGVVQVMEGRHCFAHLTVEENLLTGAYTRRDGQAAIRASLDEVYAHFPRLKARRRSLAALTSGGEQQMCAIGRALMARPRLLLLDEPSMGLAPQLVEELFDIVRALNRQQGLSVLLAEQNASLALGCADAGYVLENGRVVLQGSADALRGNEDVKASYLGLGGADRPGFRALKHYKPRKRWLA